MALTLNHTALLLSALAVWLPILWALLAIFLKADSRDTKRIHFPLFGFCLAAMVAQCFASATLASNLPLSDSVEYAVAAERLYSLGTYDLSIEGISLPPRYPPFFAILFSAPAHALFGNGLGVSIYLVGGLALVGFCAAWLTAHKIGGAWAAVTTTILLLVLPDFRNLSHTIVADGPLASIALVLLLHFSKLSRTTVTHRDFFAAGVLIGAVTLFRFSNILLAVPFFWIVLQQRKRRLSTLTLLLLPPLAAVCAQCVYNATVFGSYFRTGYHYWLAIPSYYPDLLFSLRYVPHNLATFVTRGSAIAIVLAALAIPVLARTAPFLVADGTSGSRRGLSPLLIFTFFIGLTSFAIYLPYYWFDFRFFAPLAISLTVPVGVFLAGIYRRYSNSLMPGVILTVLLFAQGMYTQLTPGKLERITTAERIAQKSPQDATVITGLDPVFLEPFLIRGTTRRIIPISRRIEFASKIVRNSPPVANVKPLSALDHRNMGLLEDGGRLPVLHTAIEELPLIDSIVTTDTPVVLDTTLLKVEETETFKSRYSLETLAENLFRVRAHSN